MVMVANEYIYQLGGWVGGGAEDAFQAFRGKITSWQLFPRPHVMAGLFIMRTILLKFHISGVYGELCNGKFNRCCKY